MERKSYGPRHAMPVQPLFIVGTKNEDGTPNFAPITWVSKTCRGGEENLIVISMYGTKKTKQNTHRTGHLTLNLVSTDMLTLTDYLGKAKGKDGVKNALPYEIGQALCVDAPTLDDARWVCECEVEQHVTIGQSDTFFCRIRNIQIDAEIDVSAGWIDLTQFDPVIYSGNYHSIGDFLGKIGEFY